MVATELILGMEELVNHIRELEAKNKKLEEENKDLKCSLAGAREVRKRLDYAIKKLEAKNKKLEEENKKLKEPMVEELEDYLEMNGAEGGIIKTQHERDFYKKKVVELKGERDFFESEFHKTLQHQADETEHYEEENKKLEGEIKRLKEEQEYQPKGSRIDPEGLHDYMKEEIDRLKEENKQLQAHYDNSIHTDWIAEAAGEDPEYFRDVCCADTLGKMFKENKKLKQPMVEDLEEYLEMRGAEGGVIKTQHERDFYKIKVNDLQKEVSRHRLMAGHLDEENKKLTENYQKNIEAAEILEDDGKEWNGNEWVDED